MALTLQLADTNGAFLSESYAILDEELLVYLSGLDGFPALQELRAQEAALGEEVRTALAVEASALAELASRHAVPAPPDWVGLDETGDIRLGEEFGWRGLLDFLRRLDHLLHLCRTMELEMWVVPEE